MRKFGHLMAAGGLAFCATADAGPAPEINFKIERYKVSGITTTEIDRSIYNNTPVVMGGQRYGAVTHNTFRTSYSAVTTGEGGCEVKNVSVVLDSTVVLPELVPGQHSQAVLNEWRRHLQALTAHEMQHAHNGKYTAETIAGRLFGFHAQMPCSEMKPRLDLAIDQLVNNMGAWDKRLDQTTQHGKTQGAYLQTGIR